MNRFEHIPQKSGVIRRLIPVLIFCIVMAVFLTAVTSVSKNTARQEARELEDSVRRSVIHCYALEGFYPEDIKYLEDNYGISYNHEDYVVSYEVIGENIMPDIMVIPLKEKGD